MKKIIVDKADGIAEVIDAMLNEPDNEITIVIPNGSVLGKSMRNFHLLKREAEAAEKTVAIESVDETILAFAKESHIEASHPLWRGVRGSSNGVSDIVPKAKKKVQEPVVASKESEDEDDEETEEDDGIPDERPGSGSKRRRQEKSSAKQGHRFSPASRATATMAPSKAMMTMMTITARAAAVPARSSPAFWSRSSCFWAVRTWQAHFSTMRTSR